MSSELTEPIIERLQAEEAKRIESQARALHAEQVAVESFSADTTIMLARVRRLGELMLKRRDEQRTASQFARFLQRRKPEIATEVVFSSGRTVLPQTLAEKLMREKPAIHAGAVRMVELRTPLFDARLDRKNEHTFTIGWQAALVVARSLHRRGVVIQLHETELDGPLYIRQTAVEQQTQDSQSRIIYEIDMATGETSSHTDGKKDDFFTSLANDADTHALALVASATNLFER